MTLLDRSPVKRAPPIDTSALAHSDQPKSPRQQTSPRHANAASDPPPTKKTGGEDIIIPFEISPPKQTKYVLLQHAGNSATLLEPPPFNLLFLTV